MSNPQRRHDDHGPVMDQDEFALDQELAPVVQLLIDGAPANGVDFVPRWEKILADERKATIVEDSRSRRRSWASVLRYAAVLACGIGVGGVVSALVANGPGSNGRTGLVAGEKSHYTANQRNLMFALLDATARPSDPMFANASRELAQCIVCHDAGLKSKLEAWRP